MASVLLERAGPRAADREACAGREEASARRTARAAPGEPGGLSLEALITSVWEALARGEAVRCPACGGTMAAGAAGPEGARGGECLDCAASLG